MFHWTLGRRTFFEKADQPDKTGVDILCRIRNDERIDSMV